MKCDELESEQWLDYSGEPMPCYPKAKADAAIAELKAKLDDLSFDKKLLEGFWKDEKIGREVASRNCIELRNENSKLLSKIESLKVGHRQGIANIKSYYRAKLEDVQATAYAESVDAGMRERRLKRALYKACANWAHHRVFVRYKTNEKAWENVERKCRAKAEEYDNGLR